MPAASWFRQEILKRRQDRSIALIFNPNVRQQIREVVHKPVPTSSGAGPLKSIVGKYDLGVFVEPDDVEEIVRGASKFVPNSATPTPDWAQYERENSWVENARNICSALS